MDGCVLPATNWWNGWQVCAIFVLSWNYRHRFTATAYSIPLAGAGVPLPGVAIRPDPSGGPPFVMVTDGRHDKVAYTFSPQTGFSQVARSTHLLRHFTTPPVVLPNGDTLTGTRDGYLTRTGQNFVQLGAFYAPGSTLTAAPTRLSDGGLVVVSREGIMTVQRGHRSQRQLAGESIASAAASCNHIFVASTNGFETFDARTLMQVAMCRGSTAGCTRPSSGRRGTSTPSRRTPCTCSRHRGGPSGTRAYRVAPCCRRRQDPDAGGIGSPKALSRRRSRPTAAAGRCSGTVEIQGGRPGAAAPRHYANRGGVPATLAPNDLWPALGRAEHPSPSLRQR